MGKIKRIWARLKRLIKEFEVKDRMSDGKLSSALIVMMCILGLILIALICILFNV